METFLAIVNAGGEDNFFRSYSAQLTTNQLEALLAELEASVEIPDLDDIPRAAYVVGKNSNLQRNTVIWAMNKDVFINGNGNLVKPEDYGFTWISHLVKDPGSGIAHEAWKASVQLSLTTEYFDIMCHFLSGSIKQAMSDNPSLSTTIEEVFHRTGHRKVERPGKW